MIAAATGDTASKYVARRETPLYIPENCTQCMECIAACPDTALPNTSQELETVLRTAVMRYVTDFGDRALMLSKVPEIETRARVMMNEVVAKKLSTPMPEILNTITEQLDGVSEKAKSEFSNIISKVPLAFTKVNAIFSSPERKKPGSGGVFSIFVSDLCKGCALASRLAAITKR
jgi:pyruvate-ferredoxin/flavodoxin oxidoreductase